MSGSIETAEGVNAAFASAAISSQSSLCRRITSPPLVHLRACLIVKGASQPSQVSGRLGGVSPYRRCKASRNSKQDRTALAEFVGTTESQAPVDWAR